ncbi:MAG: metal-dependent hydrolase [bacterium]|nr:metal-dependent hydrolase [bacterium]
MSPVAHAGLALLGWQKTAGQKNLKTLLMFLFIGNLPDIDFLFFIFIGKRAFALHQYYTHNVFFVLLGALLFFPLLKGTRERLGFCGVAVSHLVLDLLTRDVAAPVGFRLFYPLSEKVFNLGFFPYLTKNNPAEVFSINNVYVLSLELLVFVLPLLLLYGRSMAANLLPQKR